MALPPSDDDRFYKGNTLTRVFAIASVAMLIFTVWMVLDDFGREWKGYQRKFLEIKKASFDKQIESAKGAVDQAKLDEVKAKLAEVEKQQASRSKELEGLERELTKAKTAEEIGIGKFQDAKANWDVEKYEYEAVYGHLDAHTLFPGHEHEHEHEEEKPKGHEVSEKAKVEEKTGTEEKSPEQAAEHVTASSTPPAPPSQQDPKAQAALRKLADHWDKVVDWKDKANALTQIKDDKTAALVAFNSEQKKLEGELKGLRGNLERLEGLRKNSELTLETLVRNSPIIDMANPTFRLQQIVLPTIRDDMFFAQVQKVDRCTTCHQAIDLAGFEDQPNPFKTHPRLDLILGSRSPHPTEKIGCTVCHEGRGQSTHFSRSAHTPRNEQQRKAWERDYNYEEVHHIIERMIPLQFVEGKCHTCHRQTEYVPRAQKLNTSIQLIKSAGCYGCHRIEGWDHIRKPAPSLKRIKGKVTRDWMVKWIRNPRSFNQHARMPSAFHQSNINTEEFKKYNEAEIHGVADYVLSLSDDYKPNVSLPLGSKEKGKELFGSVGCLGCHQMDDFPRTRGRFGMAPDLSTVGSKVSKEWLSSWLKNPRHYWAETTMPSLRLSDGEISDLTAFLLDKKNSGFEAAATGTRDTEVQAKVMRLYLLRDPKMAPVTETKIKEAVSKLNTEQLSVELGRNAVGRYGCFGCHELKGYETTQGIGAELTEWGSKPTNKLDFGLLATERTNYHWADQKLADTRSYDSGVVKEYLDLLRMPQFGFDKDERELIITSLLGLTSQRVAAPAGKVLNAKETLVEEGSRVIHKYNCQGCHTVEKMHQPLPEGHPQFDEHEKKRHLAEGRVLEYYSEDETLGPPPLVTEGSRVQTTWAHSFLQDPSNKLRRGLKIRMPSFQMNNDELNKVVTGWAQEGGLEFPIAENKPVSLSGKELSDATTLFTKLQCNNCHTRGEGVTAADLEGGSKGAAPDLTRSAGRLNKSWIVELLKDPAKMVPGTRMPPFWPEGQSSVPDILGGDSKAQIELLADYVLSLGQKFGTKTAKASSSHDVMVAQLKKGKR